jgi:hypothetical protein
METMQTSCWNGRRESEKVGRMVGTGAEAGSPQATRVPSSDGWESRAAREVYLDIRKTVNA